MPILSFVGLTRRNELTCWAIHDEVIPFINLSSIKFQDQVVGAPQLQIFPVGLFFTLWVPSLKALRGKRFHSRSVKSWISSKYLGDFQKGGISHFGPNGSFPF